MSAAAEKRETTSPFRGPGRPRKDDDEEKREQHQQESPTVGEKRLLADTLAAAEEHSRDSNDFNNNVGFPAVASTTSSSMLHAEDETLKRSSRRKRTATKTKFADDYLDNATQREIQQAIKVSMMETKRVVLEVEECPVFHPTVEEFADPIKYIETIRYEAQKYGICKIVPPKQWKLPTIIPMDNPTQFSTKKQAVHQLQQGLPFPDGKRYDIATYKQMAHAFEEHWMATKHFGEFENKTENNQTEKSSSTSTNVDDGAIEVDGSSSSSSTNRSPLSEEQIKAKYAALEKDYWKVVELNTDQIKVEYGNDINTGKYPSGFPPRRPGGASATPVSSTPAAPAAGATSVKTESSSSSPFSSSSSSSNTATGDDSFPDDYYAFSGWNLNNIPTARGSILQHLQTPVNGVNVPWLYVGMLFASFCWHNEDNYFYSINYNHFGAGKQWYGAPGSAAAKFEKVAEDFLHGLFRESPDLLHHMTLQISPSLLLANGVPVYRTVQEAGTFVVTFPQAYHCGFGYGFNVGEAVNFATLDWVPKGGEAEERYRGFARGSVFSHHRLLFTLLHHIDSIREKDSKKDLIRAILGVLDEELAGRQLVLKQGVKNLSSVITLPNNNFEVINKQAVDYDDMRQCHACKHSCIFTAVACECNKQKVSCHRHVHYLCKCPKEKKFMLEWGSSLLLSAIRQEVVKLLTAAPKSSAAAAAASTSTSSSTPTKKEASSSPTAAQTKSEISIPTGTASAAYGGDASAAATTIDPLSASSSECAEARPAPPSPPAAATATATTTVAVSSAPVASTEATNSSASGFLPETATN